MTVSKPKTFRLTCIITAFLLVATSIPFASFAESTQSGTSAFTSTGVISTASGRAAYTVDGNDYKLISNKLPKPWDATAEYFYSDGYFMEDPALINSHLATMSMSLALSSSSSSTLQSLLTTLGFGNIISANYGYTGSENLKENAPYTIATKELEYLDGTKTGKTLIAVLPRTGTADNEWSMDFTVGNSGESTGMAVYAQGIFEVAKNYIDNNTALTQAANDGDLVFWTTAQSRGGTIANLVARRLIDEYTTKTGNTYKNPVYAYCNASVYAGVASAKKSGYDDIYNACIHNFDTDADIVTKQIPYVNESTNSTSTGFTRYGTSTRLNVSDSDMMAKMATVDPSQAPKKPLKMKYIDVNITSVTDLSEILALSEKSEDELILDLPNSSGITMEAFQQAFTKHMASWLLSTRAAYTSTPYLGTNYTREEALQSYISIFFKLSDEQLNKLESMFMGRNGDTGVGTVVKKAINDIKGIGLYLGTTKLSGHSYGSGKLVTYAQTLLKWTSKGNSEKTAAMQFILDVVNECHTSNGETLKSILGTTDYNNLEKYFFILGDMIMAFVYQDYYMNYQSGTAVSGFSGKRGILIATAIMNLIDDDASIAYQHYPTVYESSFMVLDDFYNLSNVMTAFGEVFYTGTLPAGTASAKLYYGTNLGGERTLELVDLNNLEISKLITGTDWKLVLLDSAGKTIESFSNVASEEEIIETMVVFDSNGTKQSTTQIGTGSGGILVGNSDVSVPEGGKWIKIIKSTEGKLVEFSASGVVPSVTKAMIGVYDNKGRLVSTEIADVTVSGGIMTLATESVTIPEGGTWKVFSTNDAFAPQMTATSFAA